MVIVSHSRLSSFEQCPKKYKFAYIDKVETDITGTIETFMGDLVHRALEKIYKDLKYEKLNTLQEILDFYEEEWEKRWNEGIMIVKDYSPEHYRKRGARMIKDYYNSYKPFNQEKTIGLETQWYYDLDENHKIHVRIDRLACPEEGIYEIHDYKTNSSLKTQEELDKDRQLAIYSMGVKKAYPDAKKVILVWHFLDFDKEMRSTRTTEELEALRTEVLSLIDEIQAEKDFEPVKSALCNYCEFKKICPLWKHLYETEAKTPGEFREDDGVRLVDEYVKAKEEEKMAGEKAKEIQEKIKLFSEKKGVRAVFGSTHAVNIWSKEVVKFPGKNDGERKRLVEVLKALNLYDKYADLDTWALEKEYDSLNEIEKNVLKNFARKEKLFRLYLKERDS